MLRALSISIVVASIVGCTARQLHAAPRQPWCWRPTGEADDFAAHIRALVTTSDPAAVRLRDSLRLIPVAAADVTVESDEIVCQTVATAHFQAVYEGLSPHGILVVRAGTQRYVVFDGKKLRGEPRLADVYDAELNWLASFTR